MRLRYLLFVSFAVALPGWSQHVLITTGSGGSGLVGVVDVQHGRSAGFLDTGTNGPTSVAVSHDGTHVYAALDVFELINYVNVTTGATDAQLAVPGGYPQALAISPDGSRLYASLESGSFLITIATFDTATNQLLSVSSIANDGSETYAALFAFSDNGQALYAGFGGPRLLELNAQTGALITTIPLAFNVYGLAISKTGNVLAISTTVNTQGALVIFDATTFQQMGEIPLAAGTCLGPMTLDSNGTNAYAIAAASCSSGAATQIQKFDLAILQPSISVATSAPARALNLSPSGAGLFVGEVNSVVHLSTQTLGSLEATIAQPGSVNAIAVSLDGSRVYAANSTQSAAQYAAEGVFASGPVLAVGPTSFRVHPVVTTNDGILTFVNSGAAATITVIDNQTQKVLRYLASEIDPSIIAVGSSTSPLFATSVSINGQIPSRLAKLSPSTGNLQREIDLSFSPSAMAVSPDNSQLWLLAINYGTVTVYDTFTLGVIGSFSATAPSTLTFSSDGQHCYIGSAQNNTPILDVNTQTFQTNRTLAPTLSVTFWIGLSPDGQTLYALANQSIYTARLLDGSIVSTVYVGRNPNIAALTTDGSEIYVGEKSGYLVIYDTASATVARTEFVSAGVDGLSATRF